MQDGGKGYSIIQKSDGDYKLIADRDIFNNVPEAERIETLKQFLNDNLRGKQYTALSDGVTLNIAQKNKTLQKLWRPGYAMKPDKYGTRQEVVSHYDEALEASKRDRTDPPKNNKHGGSMTDKRVLEIEIPQFDNDGKLVGSSVWEAEISVINNDDLAYDISKLQNITKDAHSELRDLLNTNPNIDRTSLPDIIAEQSNFVKQNPFVKRFSRVDRTTQTTTQNFKRWFGDWENDPQNASKVVNEDGTNPNIRYSRAKPGEIEPETRAAQNKKDKVEFGIGINACV